LTIPATLVNPWGWRIYRAILRQQQATPAHSLRLTEWASYRLNWTAIESGLSFRYADPFLILLFVAALAVPIALREKKLGAAVLMSGAAYVAFEHVRFQALFCEVMVVVAAAVLSSALAPVARRMESSRYKTTFAVTAAGFLLLLMIVRMADLVSNRTYMTTTDYGSFGAGLSWWFPERASAFIERENLPANIFNSFNEGGFFTWRLGMKYPDYIDGRNIPFGPELFERNRALMQTPPDNPEWGKEADRYNINTVLIPLARYYAFDLFPVLPQFCGSETWRPVYLDEVSAVFVRRTPATQDLIERLQIDCHKAPIPLIAPKSNDSNAFNQWLNAATVLRGLGRNSEAFESTSRALSIFQDSGYLHALRASLLQQAGRLGEAKEEYLLAVKLQPTGEVWLSLAELYHHDGQSVEAIDAWKHASDLLPDPTPALLYLGYANLESHQPQEALRFFDRAAAEITRQNSGLNSSMLAYLAHGRAVAYSTLADWHHAVQFQEEAVRIAPTQNSELYLAGLYERLGRTGDAQAAREHATSQSR
jgi:tetratricopeptide (TPR) repeat protein